VSRSVLVVVLVLVLALVYLPLLIGPPSAGLPAFAPAPAVGRRKSGPFDGALGAVHGNCRRWDAFGRPQTQVCRTAQDACRDTGYALSRVVSASAGMIVTSLDESING